MMTIYITGILNASKCWDFICSCQNAVSFGYNENTDNWEIKFKPIVRSLGCNHYEHLSSYQL